MDAANPGRRGPTIFAGEPALAADAAFAKLSTLLGLTPEIVNRLPSASQPAGKRELAAVSFATVVRHFRDESFGRWLASFPFAFVHGVSPQGEEGAAALAWLAGATLRVTPLPPAAAPHRFEVHAGKSWPRLAVCGGSYTAFGGDLAAFQGMAETPEAEPVITVDGQPHCLAVRQGNTRVFLLGSAGLADIDEELPPEALLNPWYSHLVAAALVLRAAFGDACWTSPVTTANFIIDDPWLKPSYGFVNYAELLAETEKRSVSVTVAFIPYNHRRSRSETVARAQASADRFSIAVHGCDHTGGEFASLDEAWLTATSARALERMNNHQRLTGMPYDNVMVFPQGRYSIPALRALRKAGFAAAVNSDAWARDNAANPITVRDLLEVAVLRYDRFPMFLRRYPTESFDFAFDALFQKPVLAVEHHEYFSDHCRAYGEFAGRLRSAGLELRWLPLKQALVETCQIRRSGAAELTVRHFLPEFRFRSPLPGECRIAFEKPETDGVAEVRINGAPVPFAIRDGFVHYSMVLAGGTEAAVAITRQPVTIPAARPSPAYRFKVALRRTLSDLRDNQLARHPRLRQFASRTAELLRLKSAPAATVGTAPASSTPTSSPP